VIVPPALTWTCLLEQGPSYLCDSAPVWFLQMLKPYEGQEQRVRITWGAQSTGDRKDLAGQIIINGRTASEDLEAQGFKYIRRFAVLPSLRRARWFIPLDSAAVSSGAFNIYTPARTSARIKQLAAKVLARTHLPLWYRDHVTIASRELPPVEKAIRGLFPTTDVRLALSAGAPEPARNRKPSLAVLDPAGKIVAVGKIGISALARQITAHEALVLKALSDLPEAKFQSPKLLFAGDIEGNHLVVQSALAGSPPAAQWTPAHELFLETLRRGSLKPAAYTAMVRSLNARLPLLAVLGDRLQNVLDEMMPVLEGMKVPWTIVHGDFAPWNLRQHMGRISAFDWEYAQLDGLPLIDETHFRLQVGYLLHHWTDEHAARELADVAAELPMGYTAQQARALQVIYVVDMLARLIEEGYDPNDEMLSWYRRVLRRMTPSAKEVALV
jgi:hypothetical protein